MLLATPYSQYCALLHLASSVYVQSNKPVSHLSQPVDGIRPESVLQRNKGGDRATLLHGTAEIMVKMKSIHQLSSAKNTDVVLYCIVVLIQDFTVTSTINVQCVFVIFRTFSLPNTGMVLCFIVVIHHGCKT